MPDACLNRRTLCDAFIHARVSVPVISVLDLTMASLHRNGCNWGIAFAGQRRPSYPRGLGVRRVKGDTVLNRRKQDWRDFLDYA